MNKKTVLIILGVAGLLAIYLSINSSQKNQATTDLGLQDVTPSSSPSPAAPSANSKTIIDSPKSVSMKVQPGETKQPYDAARDKKLSTMELQQLKKLTAENSKRIFAQMRTEEIQSLRTSIANDEKILKTLEASGSGIEDYKYIEQNLQKRRKRLKSLL